MPLAISDPTIAAGFAENLLRQYTAGHRDAITLFAAFVGLVVQRDPDVGNDVLIALDRFVSGDASG